MNYFSKDDDERELLLALKNFPLRAWLESRHEFTAQGRQKKEYLADCPFCGAEDKFSVSPDRRHWQCFICQKRAELIDVLAHFEGGDYARAFAIVRSTMKSNSIRQIEFQPVIEAPKGRAFNWEPQPITPPYSYEALTNHIEYTARRNFDLDNMRLLGVGVCSSGRYQGRLIFPVRRDDGHWLYFQSRVTWEKHEHPLPIEIYGKYTKNLNPACKDPELNASASDVLLGLEFARHFKRIAVVEGPTDWIQSGPDAVATFGKNISDRQILLMKRAGIEEIDLCYDPDSWEKSTQKINGKTIVSDRPAPAVAAAERLAQNFRLNVVRYPANSDAGAFMPQQNREWRKHGIPWGMSARLKAL